MLIGTKTFLSSLLCTAVLSAFAQRESLTDEFAYLTAKERSKIAKQERIDAIEDTIFLRFMQEGETLFRERSYEDALTKFKAARNRRPYNVNPKVKIEDLEALLLQREKQTTKQTVPTITRGTTSTDQKAVLQTSALPSISSVTRTQPAGITAILPDEELPPSDPRSLGLNIEQRVFIQGTARVLERVVHLDNRDDIYRKVTHEWGAIYYFKGSNTITKRTWDKAFGYEPN